MLRFEGDRDFALPAEELFGKLTDARFLVNCIPDIDTLNEVDVHRARLVIRPGLSFVRGTLNLTLEITDTVPPSSASVLLVTQGVGTSSTVEAALNLYPQGSGTHVHWAAEVKELGGLMKMMPSGLVRGAAEKVINDVWVRIEANLSGQQ